MFVAFGWFGHTSRDHVDRERSDLKFPQQDAHINTTSGGAQDFHPPYAMALTMHTNFTELNIGSVGDSAGDMIRSLHRTQSLK